MPLFPWFQSDDRLSSLDDGLPVAIRPSKADHRGLTVAVRQAATVTSGCTKSDAGAFDSVADANDGRHLGRFAVVERDQHGG
jgi:hypothetical protein